MRIKIYPRGSEAFFSTGNSLFVLAIFALMSIAALSGYCMESSVLEVSALDDKLERQDEVNNNDAPVPLYSNLRTQKQDLTFTIEKYDVFRCLTEIEQQKPTNFQTIYNVRKLIDNLFELTLLTKRGTLVVNKQEQWEEKDRIRSACLKIKKSLAGKTDESSEQEESWRKIKAQLQQNFASDSPSQMLAKAADVRTIICSPPMGDMQIRVAIGTGAAISTHSRLCVTALGKIKVKNTYTVDAVCGAGFVIAKKLRKKDVEQLWTDEAKDKRLSWPKGSGYVQFAAVLGWGKIRRYRGKFGESPVHMIFAKPKREHKNASAVGFGFESTTAWGIGFSCQHKNYSDMNKFLQ